MPRWIDREGQAPPLQGNSAQKKDDGMKAAATDSEKQKEIAGIVRAGI